MVSQGFSGAARSGFRPAIPRIFRPEKAPGKATEIRFADGLEPESLKKNPMAPDEPRAQNLGR